MSTITERLAIVMRESGQRKGQFARRIGVNERTLRTYLNGGIDSISSSVVATVCKAYNVNANWLLFEEGEMFRSEEVDNPKPKLDPRKPEPPKPKTVDSKDIITTETVERLIEQIDKFQANINAVLQINAKLIDKLTSTT